MYSYIIKFMKLKLIKDLLSYKYKQELISPGNNIDNRNTYYVYRRLISFK